jgi:hypothetical protein
MTELEVTEIFDSFIEERSSLTSIFVPPLNPLGITLKQIKESGAIEALKNLPSKEGCKEASRILLEIEKQNLERYNKSLPRGSTFSSESEHNAFEGENL